MSQQREYDWRSSTRSLASTRRMKATLRRLNLRTSLSFSDAVRAIEICQKNGWTVPADIKAKYGAERLTAEDKARIYGGGPLPRAAVQWHTGEQSALMEGDEG